MQKIKLILFYSFLLSTLTYQPEILGGMGSAVGKEGTVILIEGTDKLAKDHLPVITTALAGFGSQFGVGALETIGAGITKVAVAAKTTITVVATAPATYAIAGVVVAGYGGYKVYQHYNPSPEELARAAKELAENTKVKQEETFKECLLQNLTSPRASSGIPIPCQPQACTLAVNAGSTKVDGIVEDFVKYAPTPPAPSMLDNVKAAGNAIINSSAAQTAHAVITAPFDYTIGALADKAGITLNVSDNVKNAGKYVFAAAVVYLTVKGAKAAYNYYMTPAKDKK